MTDDFSPSAERAFELAQAAARAAGASRLGLEHLLIGVLRCGTHLPVWRPDSRPGAVGPRLADMLVAGLPAGPGTPDGPLKATPAAVAARKRAIELSTERGDVLTLPLHLLVAILEGICADPPLLGWLTGLGPDGPLWLDMASTMLQHKPVYREGQDIDEPDFPFLDEEDDDRPWRRSGPARERDRERGTPNLDRFGRDLTAMARQGTLPPLIGREGELRAMIEVLCKMTKNNPALVGEPGVGKTALVEGLAQRMAADKVPFHLRGRRLVALDLNAMIAGTRYRGDFEERLKAVLDETEKSHTVLFLDEMHTMIGAGDAEGGAGDVANVLKPYLAHGDISVIGATTHAEYRRYIERDGALERRFQPLIVKEPTPEETLGILRHLRPRLEKHYHATIPDLVLERVVELGRQHLRHRHFPDKAIDVLQTACARALIESMPDLAPGPALTPPPPSLEGKGESPKGESPAEGATFEATAPTDPPSAEGITATPGGEPAEVRVELPAPPPGPAPDDPVVLVTPAHVLSVMADLTGIPMDHFAGSPTLAGRYLAMEGILGESVFGQPDAVAAVADAVRLAKRGMNVNPQRPDGVFLFLGPTGVGKTEMGRALGRFLFGSDENVVRLDMTEYSEAHTVARLIGSPPGYVGYDEGGQFTERVRTRPFSLIVLDELEKAHPAVVSLFLQVFDEGRLTDAHGRTVYFSDATFVLTSNAGADRFAGPALGFHTRPPGSKEKTEGLAPASVARLASPTSALTEARKHFSAELLARMDAVILFRPLSREAARQIVVRKLDTTLSRIFAAATGTADLAPEAVSATGEAGDHPIAVSYEADVVDYLVEKGFSAEWGARHLERAIETDLLAPLARRTFEADWPAVRAVHIVRRAGGLAFDTTLAPAPEDSHAHDS